MDVINFCVEHINSDDVKTFCLYLMNKMRRNRIEIRPCGVVNWFNLTNVCYFYRDDFIVYLNCVMSLFGYLNVQSYNRNKSFA